NGGQSCPGAIEVRNAVTLDGAKWTRQSTAGCQPAQIDRPWVAAYTPPQYRGKDAAAAHTRVYYEYHDFGVSNVWIQASDDVGQVYVAYVRRDVSAPQPEYDVYLATSRDGKAFTTRKVNTDTGTHYMPWVAAAGDGGVDVVYYETPVVAGVGQFNKPAAAPASAMWTVQMSQSLDGGRTWTQSPVSDHPVYFGDICSTGTFCGQGSGF